MARKRYSAEQIIGHLRQAEILIAEGKTIGEAARQLSISEQTYYRWRREYGGMEVDQARRLKGLDLENQRLKRPPRLAYPGSMARSRCVGVAPRQVYIITLIASNKGFVNPWGRSTRRSRQSRLRSSPVPREVFLTRRSGPGLD